MSTLNCVSLGMRLWISLSPVLDIQSSLTPLTRIVCPFTHPASSLANNATTDATSPGSPTLFAGCKFAKNCNTCSDRPAVSSSVLIGPGAMALTVIPREPRSFASTRVICSIAPLVEAYRSRLGGTPLYLVRAVEMKKTLPPVSNE